MKTQNNIIQTEEKILIASSSRKAWFDKIHKSLIDEGYEVDLNMEHRLRYRKGNFWDSAKYVSINHHHVEYYTETWGSDFHINNGTSNVFRATINLSADSIIQMLKVCGAIVITNLKIN